MTKTEELQKAAKKLEAQVTALVDLFLFNNGTCEIDINVDNQKIWINEDRVVQIRPKVTVTIKI